MGFKTDFEAMILGAVAHGPLHGYGIVRAIRDSSRGALKAGQGQLYPILHRMEAEGLLDATWEPQGNKPPRKVYELTESGRKVLNERRRAWWAFSKAVDSIMSTRGRKEAKGNA
jgi:DNA-binding PadR family transcriptional regulator